MVGGKIGNAKKPYINNRYDIEDCILSLFLAEHHNGKDLLRLVKLFIKNGFDVNGNNGRNGAFCLPEYVGPHMVNTF